MSAFSVSSSFTYFVISFSYISIFFLLLTLLLIHVLFQYPGLFMDSFISLDLDFRLNGNKQHKKFTILTTIFYDLFDENILVQNLKKHIKIIPQYGTKGEGKTFFI